jgi:four helix bundle protein
MKEVRSKYDLEDRLIEFATQIINLVELLPASRSSAHLANQLLRSGTSPALNYGEAQSAESRNDFIHKMRICLKELRETKVILRIIIKSKIGNNEQSIGLMLIENDELISIFMKSVATATQNKKTS